MTERIRVLHIITSLGSGGAQRMLERLCRSESDSRFESTVVALTEKMEGEAKLSAPGVTVEVLGGHRNVRSAGRLLRLRRCVRRIRPHVVQGWMYHGNLAAWYARRTAPDPSALAWNVRHSLYDLQREKRLTRHVIRGNRLLSGAPEAIVYNSEKSREQHEVFGFSSAHGCVIPNGFDVPSKDPERGRRIRRALGIPDAAFVVGHAARFHPMKDHRRFLRVAARSAQENAGVHVVLLGRDVTGRNTALSAEVPADVSARFHWLGERDDVSDVMQAMDLLCLTSRWGEAFPNVLGEAMSVGVPCLTTDVGDSALVVGDCGFVVPPGDDQALHDALREIIGRTDEERSALGRRARARIRTHFGLDAVARRYASLYERLSGGASRSG